MAKQVFRKSALDKISSPDQLDKVLKVTSPMSWLALLGVTLILVFVVIWSITGSLPSTVAAYGMIVRSNTSTNTVQSPQLGTVQTVVTPGTRVYDNTPVVTLYTGNEVETINANLLGTVTEVLVKPGDKVENGTELLRVRAEMTEGQSDMVVCYVPFSEIGKIKRGMPVTVSLDENTDYGHMTGWVVNVDTYADKPAAISAAVGKENNVDNELTGGQGKAVCAVACELEVDPESASGYKWSNEKGRKEAVISKPMKCSVRIITEQVPPITKLFAKLKDIWENKPTGSMNNNE